MAWSKKEGEIFTHHSKNGVEIAMPEL